MLLHHYPRRPERQLGVKVDEIDKDNSTLVDANEQNQALKSEDIEQLKKSGKVRHVCACRTAILCRELHQQTVLLEAQLQGRQPTVTQ